MQPTPPAVQQIKTPRIMATMAVGFNTLAVLEPFRVVVNGEPDGEE
jgi:hypothetical protein